MGGEIDMPYLAGRFIRRCRFIILITVLGLMWPNIAAAQTETSGTVLGCITDPIGQPLFGVTVDVIGNRQHRMVVSNAAGCYERRDLPSDSYVVFARLPGFVSFARDQVRIDPGRTENVSFQMRIAPMCECIAPAPTLSALWNAADAIVRVRITGHKPETTTNREHIAAVLTVWKRHSIGGPAADTLTFSQPLNTDETEPYAIGQDFVIFLQWHSAEGTFVRMMYGDGKGAAFAIEDGRIRSAVLAKYVGMEVDRFLTELQAVSTR